MPKFTVTVECSSIEELDKFHAAMHIAFGGPPTPMPAPTADKPKVTTAPTQAPAAATPAPTPAPTPEPTAAPTAAPTPMPTMAPAAAPAPDADGLTLAAGTPYEKTGLPGLVTKAAANNRAEVIALLAKFGAKRASEVTAENWPALADGLKAIVAAGPKA